EAPAPGAPSASGDPRQQLDDARQQMIEAEARAAELDAAVLAAQARLAASESRLAELDERLDGLQADLEAAQDSLEAAQARRATADQQLEQAHRALRRAEANLRRHQEILARSAAGAYKHGSSSIQAVGMLDSLVHARDPSGFARILEYMDHAITAETELIERAAELRQRAAESREQLAAAQMQRAAEETAAAAARDRSLALAAEQQVVVDAAAAERGNRQQLLTALQVDQNVNIALIEDLSRRADTLTARLREQQLRALRQMLPEAMSSFLCPIAGRVQFINDWGFPRSGGRTHQGTDLFADYGTPIVAIADGVVTTMHVMDEGLGGLTVTYSVDGHRFYNAHLSAIADGIRDGARLRAGDVIGYVGVTGNARGTPPHDHFGWYPPGAGAVNPYPLLRAACR
ncbi:MAG: peptidoglycan DD-metalloendopeptidase family protein, partial [Actinomycetota bacterium]|nr:peptidoglycan DD-metalloendopeptidase family protein [Actinomycetota bacterium]